MGGNPIGHHRFSVKVNGSKRQLESDFRAKLFENERKKTFECVKLWPIPGLCIERVK
jgi:hypothetical protein